MKIGYIWLFAALLLTGVWFILLKLAAEGTSAALTQTIHVGGTVIGLLIVFVPVLIRAKLGGVGLTLGSRWPLAIVAGVVICTANYLMFKAYEAEIPLTVVPVMLHLSCIIPVAFGFVVLHDRLHPLQIAGLALAVTAAILISFPYEEQRAKRHGKREAKPQMNTDERGYAERE